MPTLDVRARAIGPWPMNTYVLVCPATRKSVLIDPGADPELLLALLAYTSPVAILLTHTHPDHVGVLDQMRDHLRVPLLAHAGPHFQGMELNAERTLAHGDSVQVGEATLRVYHTPGHIDDMLCFLEEGGDTAIVGDTLFEGGPGRTWSAAGFRTTLDTLRTIVLAWPDQTICYPGHGPHFCLGDKRAVIEAFVAREHAADFYGDAVWEMSM